MCGIRKSNKRQKARWRDGVHLERKRFHPAMILGRWIGGVANYLGEESNVILNGLISIWSSSLPPIRDCV